MSSYNPKIVTAFFREHGIPEPTFEYVFAPLRRWRFDMCWDLTGSLEVRGARLACEIQGGLFIKGRHTRGAALLKEYEKLNEAAALGWRIVFVQPSDLLTKKTADLIKRCLNL